MEYATQRHGVCSQSVGVVPSANSGWTMPSSSNAVDESAVQDRNVDGILTFYSADCSPLAALSSNSARVCDGAGCRALGNVLIADS